MKQGKWDYYYNKAETHITKINGMGDIWDKANIHYTKIIFLKGNYSDNALIFNTDFKSSFILTFVTIDDLVSSVEFFLTSAFIDSTDRWAEVLADSVSPTAGWTGHRWVTVRTRITWNNYVAMNQLCAICSISHQDTILLKHLRKTLNLCT